VGRLAERAGADAMTERVDLTLYQHNYTDEALFLSLTGKTRDARPVPKSLVIEPAGSKLVKVDGIARELGVYSIVKWKAKQLGWLDDGPADGRQGRLL
jgi:hypothetical protein